MRNNHPSVATSLNNLGLLYWALGRHSEAEPLHLEALAIRRGQLGNNHPDLAQSLNNLAGLYWTQGRYGEAEPLYLESLSIKREQLGNNHPDLALTLNNLTALYWAQGNLTQALQTQQEVLAIEEVNLALNLATLAEAQRQDYTATLQNSTDVALSLRFQSAAESPEAAEMALTTLLRRKGRILEAGVDNLQLLRQNISPSDQQRLNELATLRQQLAILIFNPPANFNRTDLDRLKIEINELEADLARHSAVFRAETQPVDISTVVAQIPADRVLVEYMRYRPYDPIDKRWGDDRYAAYLLFPNGDIQAIDLGDAAEIDAATQAFIGLLQDPSANLRAGARPERRPENVAAITQNIKTLVLDPIAPYLQDTNHLLISPDSQLNRLPFEALQTEPGGDYLVQRYQISYLNSGRDLLKLGVVEPSQQPAVILANPDYESASASPLPSLILLAKYFAISQPGCKPPKSPNSGGLPASSSPRIDTAGEIFCNIATGLQAP